jgi:hypothetical protein
LPPPKAGHTPLQHELQMADVEPPLPGSETPSTRQAPPSTTDPHFPMAVTQAPLQQSLFCVQTPSAGAQAAASPS